jgi:hypothetical protein
MKKSELRELIRECLQEELQRLSHSLTEDTLDSGAKGAGTINQAYKSVGWSCQPSKNDYLSRLKSKNPDLVSTMTVKGKDIKPGMITPAGQVKTAEVKDSGGKQKVYIMHTNNWDCFRELDQDIEVMVDPDDKSKPFTGEYRALLKMGLKESTVSEGIFDKFKKNQDTNAPAAKQEEPKEEPKEKESAGQTYSYAEWMQALEYGHKYYAEDGPEAGKTKLWDKAMDIAASENLCKDVTACMDAWMKHKGSNDFPHKQYAKHLEEDLDIDSLLENIFNFSK